MQDLCVVLYIDFIITLASEQKKEETGARSAEEQAPLFRFYFNQRGEVCTRGPSPQARMRRRIKCFQDIEKRVFAFLDDIVDST